MARSATDFGEHNTQRAVEATNYGVSWMCEIAEQNLYQSKAAADSWLTVTRKAVAALDQQASAIREQSVVVAEETLSSTFDFLHRLYRMKDPNELAQIQGEFVGRQAQIVGDQTKEFGQAIRRQRSNRDHPRAHGKRGPQPTRSGMMREAHAGNA